MNKKLLIITGSVLVLIVIFLAVGERFRPRDDTSDQTGDGNGAPIITANFVDEDKIAAITKFRSCQGHIVVPQDGSETRSNMKHYFYLKKEFTTDQGQVPLYAPFDGYVTDIFGGDSGFEDRIETSRDVSFSLKKGLTSRSDWQMTILHIVPLESMKEGESVKAGDLVGHVALEKIPPYYAFDVTYSKMGSFPKKIDGWSSPYKALESVFEHMDASVMAQYSRFGATASSDFAIPKSTRDASPCQYRSGSVQFSRELNKDWNMDWLGDLKDAVDAESSGRI